MTKGQWIFVSVCLSALTLMVLRVCTAHFDEAWVIVYIGVAMWLAFVTGLFFGAAISEATDAEPEQPALNKPRTAATHNVKFISVGRQ